MNFPGAGALNRPVSLIWILPAVAIALLLAWGLASSSILIHTTPNSLDFNPKSFGYDFETFQTETEDGVRLEGWFIPSKIKTGAAVFVLHGWGANRSDVIASTVFLGEKYNLVYFDFRSHGRSARAKTSLTCLEIRDFKAVVNHLARTQPERTRVLGVLGFSMGGAVAISGAAQMPQIRAVAAESPFASFDQTVYRFAQLFYGAPRFLVPIMLWFTRWRLGLDPEECSPIRHIAKLAPRPVFILQGGSDARMPVSEGQSLYDAAGQPKELWIIPEADHGGVQAVAPVEYQRRLSEFFEKWMKS